VELADTSAWTIRARRPDARELFVSLLEAGEIATCDIVKMELLWSVRDRDEFVARREDLDALRNAPIGPRVWRRAIDVFERLGSRGPIHHRQVAIPDLLIAAAAEAVGIGVLHYDRDFELIASITGQPVRAVVPIGSF
jgi:predicted nucleic acid-binding protein